MKSYKVHQAYINGNGKVISAGDYNETEIDIAEARAKSIITLSISNLETKPVEKPDTISVKRFNTESDITNFNLEPTVISSKVILIKINSIDEKTIEKIKYVSLKNATKVIELREVRRFTSYEDINKRVPLALSRKWEDVTSLDFEYTEPVINKPIISGT